MNKWLSRATVVALLGYSAMQCNAVQRNIGESSQRLSD